MSIENLQATAADYAGTYVGKSDRDFGSLLLDNLIAALLTLDSKIDDLDSKIDALELRVDALEE